MNLFKEFEKNAWEKKASLYEENWGSVTGQTIETILKLAYVEQGAKVLDIGCGGGHFCNLAYQKGAEVTGCDLSYEMIRIAKSNYPKITFVIEDAEKLSFTDSAFDIITMNYLLLHVADQKKVLLEARRALKENGRIIFTLWREPTNSPALNLIFDSIKTFADTTVIPPADDIFKFARLDTAEAILKEIGFDDITAEFVNTSWRSPSKESFFTAVLSGTRMGGTIELQQLEIREKIKSKIFNDLEQFKDATGFSIPMPSIVVSAKKRAEIS